MYSDLCSISISGHSIGSCYTYWTGRVDFKEGKGNISWILAFILPIIPMTSFTVMKCQIGIEVIFFLQKIRHPVTLLYTRKRLLLYIIRLAV